jgi:hypothetical protein
MAAMIPLAAALLLLLPQDPPEQARRLIEQLRSDSLEEREKAALKLVELGKAARPDVEKALKQDDPEVRASAKSILDQIARQERLDALRKSHKPLTLELKDEPFAEALRKVLGHFGMTSIQHDKALEDRRVSLRLEAATLWQAFDAFCAASKSGLRQVTYAQAWRLVDESARGQRVSTHDVGDVRLFGAPDGAQKTGDGPWENVVSIRALLPPGAFLSGSKPDRVQVMDARDSPIKVRGEDVDHSPDRTAGSPTETLLWSGFFDPKNLPEAGTLRIRGLLRLRLPRDLERHAVDLQAGALPAVREIAGARLTLTGAAIDDKDDWRMNLQAKAGRDALKLFLWTEDAEGRWLFDTSSVSLGAGASTGLGCSRSVPKDARPARLVLNRLVSEDEYEIPFDLRNVPLPDPPPKDK